MKRMMERKEKISSNFIRNENIFRVLLFHNHLPESSGGRFSLSLSLFHQKHFLEFIKMVNTLVCKFQVILHQETELKNRSRGVEKIQTFLYCVVAEKEREERGNMKREKR